MYKKYAQNVVLMLFVPEGGLQSIDRYLYRKTIEMIVELISFNRFDIVSLLRERKPLKAEFKSGLTKQFFYSANHFLPITVHIRCSSCDTHS